MSALTGHCTPVGAARLRAAQGGGRRWAGERVGAEVAGRRRGRASSPRPALAWFVIDAVAAMALAAFYAVYRADGHGRPAHEPSMMVTLLMYYAIDERSSRRIAANQIPDHTTIARFRRHRERALANLFGQVLGLCAQAGLV
jgi:hypothetical protein